MAEISVYATYTGEFYLYAQLHLISIYNVTLTSTNTEQFHMEEYAWSVYGVCIEILCI